MEGKSEEGGLVMTYDEKCVELKFVNFDAIEEEICAKCTVIPEDEDCDGCLSKKCPFSGDFKELIDKLYEAEIISSDIAIEAENYAEA